MDVGVDANNYYPVSLDQVRERMILKVARTARNLGMGKWTPDFIASTAIKGEVKKEG